MHLTAVPHCSLDLGQSWNYFPTSKFSTYHLVFSYNLVYFSSDQYLLYNLKVLTSNIGNFKQGPYSGPKKRRQFTLLWLTLCLSRFWQKIGYLFFPKYYSNTSSTPYVNENVVFLRKLNLFLFQNPLNRSRRWSTTHPTKIKNLKK